MTPRTLPIQDRERADVLDALRAFALLGIFISHVPAFSGYTYLTDAGQMALDRFGFDTPLFAVSEFLIRGKFFSLFSLLFGIGFAVQIDSAIRRGASFARHFARRLAVLGIIGLVHAFIWYGDILKDYALLGLLLIPMARWNTTKIALAIGVVFLLRALWPFLILYTLPILYGTSAGENPVDTFGNLTNAFGSNDPGVVFGANLELVKTKILQMIYDGKAISVFGMFLLGALIGRLGLYKNLPANEKLLKWVLGICGPVGVLGNAVLVHVHAITPRFPPTEMWAFEQSLFAVAVPAMALAYASGFALLWIKGGDTFLRKLAPAGRMALTTYVSQTLIGVFVFYNIGLGFRHTIGLAEGTVFAVLVFAAQCVVAALWLRAFRFGPLEWVWRRATYGTPITFRR